MVPILSVCVSTGSVQHLRDDWWTSPGPLLSRDVLSMCKLNCKSSLKWRPEVLRGKPAPLMFPQGAVVGLVAGLVMAFWIGIGSFVMRVSGQSGLPPLNNTAFVNMSSSIVPVLVNSTAAPR